VAIGASLDAAGRGYNVSTCQRKACCTVVKLSVRPQHRVMASRAERGGEICRDVIGHGTAKRLRTVPICRMTAGVVAIRHGQAVIVVYMALVAVCGRARGCHLVIACECPPCARVVEGVIGPSDVVVTVRAI